MSEPPEIVRTPAQLSRAFLEAYNDRDAETMRSMLAPEVVYIRPGPTRIRGREAIMDRYRRDWERYDNRNVIRSVIEDDEASVMEIGMKFPDGAETDAAVVTRWAGELMVSYRLYMDQR